MRSSGRAYAAAILVAVLAAALRAQPAGPPKEYADALARESALRRELDAPIVPSRVSDVLRRLRATVADYDEMSRKHPASGYSDNALWQGATLSADAFWQFGEPADRLTARRLLQSLTSRFPSSSLVEKVPSLMVRLDRATVPASDSPAPNVVAATAAVGATAGPTTLTDIRREILPDAVRVTLALESEMPFASERLENPPRLFIDLKNTRVVYALKDAKLTFDDDIVRQIRVGRQEGVRTRVVLDLEGAGRSSIYPVYNPYRLVIDFERPGVKSPAIAPLAGAKEATIASAPAPGPAPREVSAPRIGPAAPKSGPVLVPTPPTANTRGGLSLSRQLGLGVARIVIDPGHGGHDPGARVNGLTEAELVLDIALRLEKLLAQPGVEVMLTRRTSTFVALEERTAIANRSAADLFLSIHANASNNTDARGVETYFLNFAPNAEAEAIAARENAASARTMRNLTDIVRAIALNNKIDESRDFAGLVQTRLYDGLRKANKQARNLGVKQAPFQVLIGASMPSILAEISFITNRQEGGLLKTDKYREEIAKALSKGVMAYQQALKRTPDVASQ
jgi:N-acetylmuramoyl-L-alanine amidase